MTNESSCRALLYLYGPDGFDVATNRRTMLLGKWVQEILGDYAADGGLVDM